MIFLTENEIVDNIVSQIKMISPEGKSDEEYLKSCKREDMIVHHHGMGMHVRNEYKLWHPDNPLTKEWHMDRENNGQKYIVDGVDEHPFHPDAVSMNILYKVWDNINESN